MTHAFLQSIIAAPEDDAPRLVFADWLDENGDGARAEFIRCQIELARLGSHTVEPFVAGCNDCERAEALHRRERELWNPIVSGWLKEPLWKEWRFHWEERSINATPPCVIVRRGWPELAICSWANWRTHAAAILAAAPLTTCNLTTRSPHSWLVAMERKHGFRTGLMDDAYLFYLAAEYGPRLKFTLPPANQYREVDFDPLFAEHRPE